MNNLLSTNAITFSSTDSKNYKFVRMQIKISKAEHLMLPMLSWVHLLCFLETAVVLLFKKNFLMSGY